MGVVLAVGGASGAKGTAETTYVGEAPALTSEKLDGGSTTGMPFASSPICGATGCEARSQLVAMRPAARHPRTAAARTRLVVLSIASSPIGENEYSLIRPSRSRRRPQAPERKKGSKLF